MQCGGGGGRVVKSRRNCTMTFHVAKTLDQFIVNCGVFGTFIRAYDRFQGFQIGIKTLAICVRNLFGFATLIMHLIHVVSELLVLEGHLCIIRRRIHVVYHVRHCGDCRFI
jgi:hypothetical protein